MAQAFVCANGHRWEDSFGDGLSLGVGGIVSCPQCGAAIEPVRQEPPIEPPTLVKPTKPDESAVVPSDALGTVPSGGPFDSTDPTQSPLTAVPGYLIVKELGRGGMGVVYQARQVGLKRTVALKMILGGAHAGTQALGRFRAEAEAVARLQHPNIVQIYEIGEHEGRPYYSMEFVEGGNLFEKIYDNPLPAREAARMIAILARAMHTAHAHGIVHRDLKPANILLNQDGTPKITDFGLAKNLTETAGQTRTGEVMGTPSYMAPEQAEGRIRDTGPPTDVYALGAILYELLTARPPFKAETAMDTLLQVLYQDPLPPARLLPSIPADLETICLHCLNKEIAKRYLTALELAEDLERYLDRQPIRARPVALRERVWKWARRRPALAGLLAVSVLAILIIVGGSVYYTIELQKYAGARDQAAKDADFRALEANWERLQTEFYAEQAENSRAEAVRQRNTADEQRRRAEHNFHQAQKAVKQLLLEAGRTELAATPLMEDVRQRLLGQAVLFYRDFLEKQSQDPVVRFEGGRAQQQLGDIYRLMGDFDQAADSQRAAIRRFEELSSTFPSNPAYRRELALSHFLLGQLYRAHEKPAEEEEAFQAAIRIQERLTGSDPANVDYRNELAQSINELARTQFSRDQPEAAEATYRRALELQEALVKDHPEKPALREYLAGSYNDLGALLRALRRPGDAEQVYYQALPLLEWLVDHDPRRPTYRQKLAGTRNNLGNVLRDRHELAKAEKVLRQALADRQKLADDFRSILVYRQELAHTHNNLASALNADKRPDEAAQESLLALALQQQLADDFPFIPDYRSNLAVTLDNQAALAMTQGQFTKARELLARALPHHEAARQARPDNPIYRGFRMKHYLTLAETLVRAGKAGSPSLHAEIAQAAADMMQCKPTDPDLYYRTAVILAHGVLLVDKDTNLAAKDRPKVKDGYAGKAVQLLDQAIERGYANLRQLQIDKALDPLRARSDFKELVVKLENKKP